MSELKVPSKADPISISKFGPDKLNTQATRLDARRSGRSHHAHTKHDAKGQAREVRASKHKGGNHTSASIVCNVEDTIHNTDNTIHNIDNTIHNTDDSDDTDDTYDADDANDGVQLRDPLLMGDCIQWGEIPSGLTIKEWPRIAGVILSGKLPKWPSAPRKEAVPNAWARVH